jgi:hypothetical protein
MGAALEAKLPQLQAALASGLNFAEVERALQETMAQLTATILERLLVTLMQEPGFVAQLKRFGGRLGMRLKEYWRVRLRLAGGKRSKSARLTLSKRLGSVGGASGVRTGAGRI